jgi:glycogen debranching enzyme
MFFLKIGTFQSIVSFSTHDNETPHQKRTAEDSLPNAAIVAMSHCAIGSVKGYDEIVPELLDVVNETRLYRVADPCEGIIPAKSMLLNLHTKMAREGYTEIHVHQEEDYVIIHRVHPVTHDGYLLIARCSFRKEFAEVGKAATSPLVACLTIDRVLLSPFGSLSHL